MSKTLEKDVEKLKDDLARFRDDLSNTISDIGTYSQDKVMQTTENLKHAKAAFKGIAAEKFVHANEYVHEQGERAINASREMVQHRPLTTIAVSFGAGILAALLLERSNHK